MMLPAHRRAVRLPTYSCRLLCGPHCVISLVSNQLATTALRVQRKDLGADGSLLPLNISGKGCGAIDFAPNRSECVRVPVPARAIIIA